MSDQIEARAMSLDDRFAARMFWRTASPYMRLLDVQTSPVEGGAVLMKVAAHERISLSADDPRQHPLILPGLADDCLSFAIGHQLDGDVGILTLDMWLSFSPRQPDGSTIRAIGRMIGRNGDTATSHVTIEDDCGPLLTGVGTFLTGRYPSGKEGDRSSAGRFDAAQVRGPFAAATGLKNEPDGVAFSGVSNAIIGWEAGPAVHGGATAALLCAACKQMARADQKMVSIHIRYLRPAIGAKLHAVGTVDIVATRASHISARAFTDTDKPVATCVATFSRNPSGANG